MHLPTGGTAANAQGLDMNRSYRPAGSHEEEQTPEPHLWQRDLEGLMRSGAPVTTIWAMHAWPGIVEPLLTRGSEIGTTLPDWTRRRDIMLNRDPLGLIEPLRPDEQGSARFGATTWTAGPHGQFGNTAVLCEGGAVLQTRELNRHPGRR
jgi:hypothetical protein